MISEQYWQIVRRWYWLIAACAVLGAAAAVFALPPVTGGSAQEFETKVSLSVTRFVSATRIVTAGEPGSDGDVVIADYTDSFAPYATTDLFRGALRQELELDKTAAGKQALAGRVTITANGNLFRIDVQATAGTRAGAETLAKAAASVLSDKAKAEDQVAGSLIISLEGQQQTLSARLVALQREQSLAGRGQATRDPRLIELEVTAVDDQLAEKTRQRETLLLNRASGSPLTPATTPESVQKDAGSLTIRDYLLLGLAGGLVVGWMAANFAERRRTARETGLALHPAESVAANVRLQVLLARAAEIERRAQALLGPADASR